MGSTSSHLFLAMLATAEKARGRGAARLLVQWGKHKANELGVPCYLSALPRAVDMYKRHGWRSLGPDVRDVRPWIREEFGTAGQDIAEEDVHMSMVLDPSSD